MSVMFAFFPAGLVLYYVMNVLSVWASSGGSLITSIARPQGQAPQLS